jgi:hypothetical protein
VRRMASRGLSTTSRGGQAGTPPRLAVRFSPGGPRGPTQRDFRPAVGGTAMTGGKSTLAATLSTGSGGPSDVACGPRDAVHDYPTWLQRGAC